jgi:integrase
VETKRDVGMLPIVEQALRARRAASELQSTWVFANHDRGPLDITNLRERVWRPALRQAKLRARTLYQTLHTFATRACTISRSDRYPSTWVARS